MRKNISEIERFLKKIVIFGLFLGIFSVIYSPRVTPSVNAVTLSPEAQKCSEEPKKQGKQANPDYKMSWMYSEKKKACFYTFAELQSNSLDMKSGVRKKDASGNVTEFYIYEKEQSNSALTILSMIELSSGDIVIGGSEWLMSSDFAMIGFYAIISADASVKYKSKISGQSVEKVNTDNNVIVLAGSVRHTGSEKADIYVTPYIVTTDMDGNQLEKKEFENLRGYWFADAKLYKSKYIRTSLGEYKSQSNGAEGPVKWLNAETLAEVNETEVNLEVQTTYTKNGYVKYDGNDIISYNQSGEKLKSVAYTASVSKAIPLPQQDENTFIIAEIGSTVVLKSITVNGEKGKEIVDTKIGVATTDKIDFRQNGDTVSLYIIGSKGEEFIYDLDLSQFVVEQPTSEAEKTDQKSNQSTLNQKDASDENKMIFFIMIGAVTVIVSAVVMTIVLFIKKRGKKSKTPKTKINKNANQKSQPKAPETMQQQQSGYLQPQFNPYVNQSVYEEPTYAAPEVMNDERVSQTEYANPTTQWNEQQYDAYGNTMNTQQQYDMYGNVMNAQQYDAYGNVMNAQQYDAYGNVMNAQQYDAYGNVINTQQQYDMYGNGQGHYVTSDDHKEE